MLEFLAKNNKESTEPGNSNILMADPGADSHIENKRDQAESFIKNTAFKGTSLPQYSLKCLSGIAKAKEICQGAFFVIDEKDGRNVIRFVSGFATPDPGNMPSILEIGEGFPGQVAKDGRMINITDIPEGYFMIESGLGKAAPVSLLVFPVKHENEVVAVIELSSFRKFTAEDESFFHTISPSIAEQILRCKKNAE